MCKLIAELVGTDKRILREIVNRLEQASGAPGIDLRLTGEIYGSLHMKMRELGLDPNDTTPHELYQALLNLASLHDKFLARRIGISNNQDPEIILSTVAKAVNEMNIQKQSWALKHVTAKRLLKAMPPKTLMKLLHYRSVDSMLKREPTAMLLTAARHIEPAVWQEKFTQSYKRLKSNDFKTQEIEVMYMDSKGWKQVGIAFSQHRIAAIVHTPEIAAILMLPLSTRSFHGLTLASLLIVIHYINEIRAYGSFINFHHMRGDFGKFLMLTLHSPKTEHARLAGQPIHWRIIQRHYGADLAVNHPEIFKPHIQPEDLSYRKAEAILYRLEPALHFWNNMDYVGLPQLMGKPISFSLTDVALNLLNRIPYDNRTTIHLQDSLWNELYIRYMSCSSLERQLLRQLDEQVVSEPEPVMDMEFVW